MTEVKIIHGSCADQTADVVVNAANRYLAAGGGICGVIFNKAGYMELTAACDKRNTPLKDGDVEVKLCAYSQTEHDRVYLVYKEGDNN